MSQALIWESFPELTRRTGERKTNFVIAARWPFRRAFPDSAVVSQTTISPSLDPDASKKDMGSHAMEQMGLACPLNNILRAPEIFQMRTDPSPYPTAYSLDECADLIIMVTSASLSGSVQRCTYYHQRITFTISFVTKFHATTSESEAEIASFCVASKMALEVGEHITPKVEWGLYRK